MHLTGVKTDFQNSDSALEKPIGYLHAVDFYNRCLSHKLSPKDFEFSDDETTHMKLSVLPYVINKNLNANMIGTYNLNKPNLYTDKIAGGIKACMGFVIDENHNSYVPNTLLKEDIRHIVNNYARVILVFRKDIHEDNYKELTYRVKNVTWDKVKIPEDIASLLLAGIISDTLMLKSPTATKIDERVVNDLVKITNLNPEKLAIEMFKANDVTKSKNLKEIIYMDFKTFVIDKTLIGVSQVTTLNAKAILKQKNSYIRFLNKEANHKNFDIMVLAITDIFKNGSYILFNDKAKDILKEAYNEKIGEGDFIEGMVSRKKQILPPIISVLK